MTEEISTLQKLLRSLPADPELSVVFETEEGEISPGYHVTEYRVAKIEAIDCGRGRSAWNEAQLQLLDGSRSATEYMRIGKFRQIAEASLHALPDLGDATLIVEFAPGNAAFSRYSPASVERRQGRVYIGLTAHHAVCKPSVDLPSTSRKIDTVASSICCGSSSGSTPEGSTACCG